MGGERRLTAALGPVALMALIWSCGGARTDWLCLVLALPAAEALCCCAPEGLRAVCTWSVSEEERSGALAAALAVWALGAVLLFGLFGLLEQLDALPGPGLLAAGCGALWSLARLAGGWCRGNGHTAVAAWGEGLGALVVGALALGCALFPQLRIHGVGGVAGTLALSALFQLVLGGGLAALGRRGERQMLRDLPRQGRAFLLRRLCYLLPGALLAGLLGLMRPEEAEGLLAGYLLGASVFELCCPFGRLEPPAYERLEAYLLLPAGLAVTLLSLLAQGAAGLWCSVYLPCACLCALVWACPAPQSTQAWFAALPLILMIPAQLLPWPFGGAACALLLTVQGLMLRPAIYSAWLPLRARLIRRRRG